MFEGLSRREAARRFGIDPRPLAKMLAFSVAPGYRWSHEARSVPADLRPSRRPDIGGYEVPRNREQGVVYPRDPQHANRSGREPRVSLSTKR